MAVGVLTEAVEALRRIGGEDLMDLCRTADPRVDAVSPGLPEVLGSLRQDGFPLSEEGEEESRIPRTAIEGQIRTDAARAHTYAIRRGFDSRRHERGCADESAMIGTIQGVSRDPNAEGIRSPGLDAHHMMLVTNLEP